VDVEDNNFSSLASIRVRSDVKLFIDAILPRLKSIKSVFHTLTKSTQLVDRGKGKALQYAKALATFSDAIFSLDTGLHTIWLMQEIKVKRPRHIIFSGNLSAMGYSLPAGIGAKISSPNSRVIVVTGDGGFQMAAPELSTIKENDLNIAICVFNNKTLGLIRQLQEKVYGRIYGVDYSSPPDYVKLAEAHGVKAIRADSPSDVIDALKVADEPLVVEMPITKMEGVELSQPRILNNES
jgi:acetolactate synthase-1/2/3 large subunit